MIEHPPRHSSMRGYFGNELHKYMTQDPNIIVVTANLSYGLFDFIKQDYPSRFIDTGVSEQVALGLSVGLASEGKIPVVYSITPFLLYRPFEIIRNNVDKYQIPVKLVGSGRDKDYFEAGFSHWSEDAITF